jgi:signal transduction histidine kinase
MFGRFMQQSERIDLGRTEAWLRSIGVVIWAFVGLSRLDALASSAWLAAWAVYGAGLIASGLHRRMPQALAVILLLAQSGAAIGLPSLGFAGFEGLLMSIVVAQVPTILSIRAAIVWALVQEAPLLAIVYSFKSAVECMEILGAYSTFSAFTLLVYWLHRRELRARRELAESNAELLATRALLVEGVRQSERVRISRELHDSLGHHLTALSVQLELARRSPPEKMGEPVARAQDVTKSALEEVRTVVSAMRSPEGFDLLGALKAIASWIPKPRVHIAAKDAWCIEDGATGHAVFRCIQEAITNSLKHADASNIWVDVERSEHAIKVQVRDDGKLARDVKPGHGLSGIKGRMDQIGGSAEFRSVPGESFSVVLTAPLTRSQTQ